MLCSLVASQPRRNHNGLKSLNFFFGQALRMRAEWVERLHLTEAACSEPAIHGAQASCCARISFAFAILDHPWCPGHTGHYSLNPRSKAPVVHRKNQTRHPNRRLGMRTAPAEGGR